MSPQLPRLQTELHRNKAHAQFFISIPLLVNLTTKQLDLTPLGGSKTLPRGAQLGPKRELEGSG